MTEVYDILTGSKLIRAVNQKDVLAIAKENDRFRKKFSWKTDMEPSIGFMKLQRDILADVLFQLKRSHYSKIDYGSLSEHLIPTSRKLQASAMRSGGVIHAGKPKHHIIWNINQTTNKIEVCLGSEAFKRH